MASGGLRVLTHTPSLGAEGGVELCTLQLSQALTARGHEVDLMYRSDGSLRSAYESAGVGLHGPFDFHFEPRHALRDVAGFLPAARWARRAKPTVLWLNRFEHIVWAQTVARASGTPVVCHLHHMPNYRKVRQLSAGVRHFIAVSHFIRNVWVDAGLPADRVSVVHNAVPTDAYPVGGATEMAEARRRLGLPQDARVVLYYGRMVPEKGVSTLVEAWDAMTPRPGKDVLLLAGSPDPASDRDLLKRLRRLPPATYRVLPAQSDVLPLLHAADVVSFPSWVDEAFGRVPLEALSTGRPVVASSVGAVPEVLTGEMASLLVPSKDAAALAHRLRSLLEWRTTQPRLGEDCAAWAAARFPFGRHVEQVESILSGTAADDVAPVPMRPRSDEGTPWGRRDTLLRGPLTSGGPGPSGERRRDDDGATSSQEAARLREVA